MRIVVCLKQVYDLAQLRYKSDGRIPLLEGLPVQLGSFEKNALEQALRFKEAASEVEVVALSAGVGKLQETIKEALAMGADRAALVIDPALGRADAAGTARALAAAIQKLGGADLILLGEGSDDEYTGQIPSRLAALLDLPQITFVRSLELVGGMVRAGRDLEHELEIVECELPAVVSVTSELNTPRLPPLSAILRAGRKPMQAWSLHDLGLSADLVSGPAAQIEVLSNLAPAQARKNVMLEGDVDQQVSDLVAALEREGVLP
ncbi:MAG TPA: electron transfer flavoprotein subunit beta/FixA family protein [Anaerolineales bacterium]